MVSSYTLHSCVLDSSNKAAEQKAIMRVFSTVTMLLCMKQTCSWTMSCFLEKHCAQLPSSTHVWDLIENHSSRGKPVPVKECFKRVPLAIVGDSRLGQLRHIINSLTL